MAATGILAKGFKLYMSTDGTTYTQLVDILSVGDIGAGTGPQVDITPLDSTEVRREKLAGMLDTGELAFSQLYTHGRWTALDAVLLDNIWWRATLPDLGTPTKLEWRGTLNQLALGALSNPDDRVAINGSIIVSGDMDQTPGT